MSLDEAVFQKDDTAVSPGENSPVRWRLYEIVSKLRTSRDVTHNIRQDGPTRRAPSRDILETAMKGLIEALFPRHYGRSDLDKENIDYFVGNTLNVALNALLEQVHR